MALTFGAVLSAVAAGHAQRILVVKCQDPWINQAYIDLYQRDPSVSNASVPNAVDGECNPALYGRGQWSSYNDLEDKIMAVKGPRKTYTPPQTQGITVDLSRQVLIDNGVSTPLSQVQIMDSTTGNLLSPAAVAQIFAQGGGNIVAQGGGNYRVSGAGPSKKTYMLRRSR